MLKRHEIETFWQEPTALPTGSNVCDCSQPDFRLDVQYRMQYPISE